MQRTTLRTIIGTANKEQPVEIPEGTRRIQVRPNSQTSVVYASLIAGAIEKGNGNQATFDSPYSTGLIIVDHGPIYVAADYRGTLVEIECLHAKPDTSDPGSGGGGGGTDGPPFGIIYKTFIPTPNTAAILDTSNGSTVSWTKLPSWSNVNASTDAILTDDDPISQYLVGTKWKPRNSAIPAGADIREIILHLDANLVLQGSTALDVQFKSIRVVRDGILQDFDYVTNNGNGPTLDSTKYRFTFKPEDDPLWGQSWTADDFNNSSNDDNPQVIVTTTQEGEAAGNEIQGITLPATVSGGTFTLTFSGQTTAAIAWNANAAAVQAALEALSNVAPGDVIVTAGPLPDQVLVEFDGAYAGLDVPIMSGNGASLTLTGGGGPINIYSEQEGGQSNTIFWLVSDASNLSQNPPISLRYQYAPNYYGNGSANAGFTAAQLKTVTEGITGIGVGNVSVNLFRIANNCSGYAFPYNQYCGHWVVTFEFKGIFAGTDHRINGDSRMDDDEFPVGWFPPIGGPTWGPPSEYENGVLQVGGSQNEKQTIALLGAPTGGTFTLTFQGQTTAALAYNISNAALKTALEALSNIGPGDITITGGPLPNTPVTVEFGGTLAEMDVQLMTGSPSFTGAIVDIETTQETSEGEDDTQLVTLVGGTAAGVWGLTVDLGSGDETTADISATASAATVQTALEALASLAPGDVVVTGDAGGPYTVVFGGTFDDTDVEQMRGKSGLTSNFGFAISVEVVDTEIDGSVRAQIFWAEVDVGYER
jgi:hypothetical protein